MTNDLAFFSMSGNLPYILSGCLLCAIFLLEIVGLLVGFSSMFHTDVDFSADLNGNGIPDYLEVEGMGVARWINPGHVPLMIYIVIFSTVFTVTGFVTQWLCLGVLGNFLSNLIVAPMDLVVSMAFARYLTLVIAQILPKDVTSAITLESLIGQSGPLVIGPADQENQGVMRVTDQYGTDHYISVLSFNEEIIANGEKGVLMAQHPSKLYVYLAQKI